jgi:BirA family biotin operon repressor/biotin-[acetyl-CoA-carboxylase] ligase
MDIVNIFPEYVVYELTEVDSTNKYVERQIGSTSFAEGSVIFTNNQTAGIGQGENKWESEPFMNLIATTLLNPSFLSPTDQFYLTMVVSLATCETVDSLLKNNSSLIKWPNDIYIEHRKVAGILIKNYIMGQSVSTTIAGIGLNVNQTKFNFAPNATSLKLLSGQNYDIPSVLTKWHTLIAEFYQKLKDDKFALRNLYLTKLYLKDQFIEYTINDRKVTATITGIDQHGQLELADVSGKIYTCGLKEVVFPILR